jgi:hypothetical protein
VKNTVLIAGVSRSQPQRLGINMISTLTVRGQKLMMTKQTFADMEALHQAQQEFARSARSRWIKRLA